MMFRFAAVRPDGTIARIVTGSIEEAIDSNMPANTNKIEVPEAVDPRDTVKVGTHIYDFSTEAFRPVDAASEGQA